MSIPLSLYIHIPWCQRKCPYCDFNSHALRGELPVAEYLAALLQDLRQQLSGVQNRPVQSIFIGGGTPSLMPGEFYHNLLNKLGEVLTFTTDVEITLEANPGTVEQGRFSAYREAGINRLSLGVQSLNEEHLQKLGRIHDASQAKHAVEMARKAGFENFNLDLMFGLPQQSIDQALEDLSQAIALRPTHLSWYQLTLEPNTYFHRFPPTLPDDDLLWEMQQQGQELLAKAGYTQYEVSAYAQSDFQCRHNLNYWQFGDYIGIGAGAHGKVTTENFCITRRWNVKHPQEYLNPEKNFCAGTEIIEPSALPFEFMLNALRLQQPVPIELFTARTGLSVAAITPALTQAKEQGLMDYNAEKLEVTGLGRRFLNDVIQLFMR